MKKRFDIIAVAFGFAVLLAASALHRHESHGGGMYGPHTDCLVCFTGPRRDGTRALPNAPTRSGGSGFVEARPVRSFPILSFVQRLFPFGRAPPAII